jgi:flagellar basal-body rod modification protein FlgD
MFLNLLVAQIQNQDPLNPTDSAQFVSQLTQISELEQTIGIRSDIETYMGSSSSSSQAGSNSNQTTDTLNQTAGTGQNTPAANNLI